MIPPGSSRREGPLPVTMPIATIEAITTVRLVAAIISAFAMSPSTPPPSILALTSLCHLIAIGVLRSDLSKIAFGVRTNGI